VTRFLPKNGGLNGWAIIGVLLKTSDKNIIKKLHNGKQEKQENIKKNMKKRRFEI
jgi:hypothetical protein